jgi:two-component system KDP operon response regulator KdpE
MNFEAQEVASKKRILLVDDDTSFRKALRYALEVAAYEVIESGTGEGGMAEMAYHGPDILILDVGLPDMSGLDFLKRVREWSNVPVLVLTVSDDDEKKVTALDLGADHYLTKPTSMGELLARLRVILRRSKHEKDLPVVRFGDVEFDLERLIVTRRGAQVKLPAKEHAFLRLLALNAGKVLTHRHILKEIWGPDDEANTPYLHVYMSKLRSKLEDDPARPKFLKTEPRVGFRLLLND